MNYSQLRVEVLKYSSWWGKTMKALNYKPKTWAAYAVYCSIPLVFYIYYLYRCVKEESVIQKLAEVTNDYPILWGVYIVVLAIPVVFVLYLCCRPSSSASQPQQICRRSVTFNNHLKVIVTALEKEEQLLSEAAEKKKTDEVSEDIEEENNEIETETEAKADVNDEDPEKNSDPDSEEDNEAVVEEPTESKAGGDGARKRKVRKD
ncbi:hypothetical protein NQ315_013837 [Exocentrus adspersus]|uniref:Uncharacterized protein n=1 Tax=Exocentrus adspersus TaxID=1586481 RepID=A0AAV8VGZ1_9CUCU|nr:hypothetical protein NQ315_013837 [Exocentrus adspersus]